MSLKLYTDLKLTNDDTNIISSTEQPIVEGDSTLNTTNLQTQTLDGSKLDTQIVESYQIEGSLEQTALSTSLNADSILTFQATRAAGMVFTLGEAAEGDPTFESGDGQIIFKADTVENATKILSSSASGAKKGLILESLDKVELYQGELDGHIVEKVLKTNSNEIIGIEPKEIILYGVADDCKPPLACASEDTAADCRARCNLLYTEPGFAPNGDPTYVATAGFEECINLCTNGTISSSDNGNGVQVLTGSVLKTKRNEVQFAGSGHTSGTTTANTASIVTQMQDNEGFGLLQVGIDGLGKAAPIKTVFGSREDIIYKGGSGKKVQAQSLDLSGVELFQTIDGGSGAPKATSSCGVNYPNGCAEGIPCVYCRDVTVSFWDCGACTEGEEIELEGSEAISHINDNETIGLYESRDFGLNGNLILESLRSSNTETFIDTSKSINDDIFSNQIMVNDNLTGRRSGKIEILENKVGIFESREELKSQSEGIDDLSATITQIVTSDKVENYEILHISGSPEDRVTTTTKMADNGANTLKLATGPYKAGIVNSLDIVESDVTTAKFEQETALYLDMVEKFEVLNIGGDENNTIFSATKIIADTVDSVELVFKDSSDAEVISMVQKVDSTALHGGIFEVKNEIVETTKGIFTNVAAPTGPNDASGIDGEMRVVGNFVYVKVAGVWGRQRLDFGWA